MMRALDPEVGDAVWAGIKPLIPAPVDNHPLGCHRRRAADRDCFEMMLVREVTGCSWEDAERLCGNKVSDTTARDRRDEWIKAGVFTAIAKEAIAGYDKIVGLDLTDVAVDGSLHKSPAGGNGQESDGQSQARMEVVDPHRPKRHPHRLGHRRSQSPRLGDARTDAQGGRRARVAG